jgi:pimeloyl-ACP methyl ester carboxylesterase
VSEKGVRDVLRPEWGFLRVGGNPNSLAFLPEGMMVYQETKDLLPMVRSHTGKIPRLREFKRPVRIIFGDADYTLNSGVARTFHEFFPESELFLIPGARHFVQLDEPEQVGRLILAMPPTRGKQV